jgi:hypothetical protein
MLPRYFPADRVAARAMLRLSLAASIVVAMAAPVGAQKVRLEVGLPAQPALADEPPSVASAGLLADASMRDLLANGFPARLH